MVLLFIITDMWNIITVLWAFFFRHPIIKKLSTLTTTNVKLAELVTKQLFANALLSAGLVDDPRTLLTNMNEILTLALEKH
ncbi:Heat shock protein 75 kDa, mitochondrial [Zootermopsis nevadensis]|uniref:Heat shock protein 75 kDa, mitochondrial n=2 Tax=Zootermopsis nevadensis TaxID=136037 RepID=A0A067RMC8_ZOONE|nr:Heat shock protein 75 kDa, mitochondrial [Zootermopsis nevadensis]